MQNLIPSTLLPVAIIGAGPIGLAAAAHLVQRGQPFVMFEAGNSVAAHLQGYRQVQLFSPWQYNTDKAAVDLLAQAGWLTPAADVLPTAAELVDTYLLPLSRLPSIAPYLHLNARVQAVSRQGFDKVKTRGRASAPFVLRVDMPGGVQEFHARAVIDASGTWSQPNPLGGNGLPALGEREHADQIRYGMPDILGAERVRYAGKKVLVVGAGHSAAGSLIALASLAEQEPHTRLVWVVRGSDTTKVFGGGAADGLPARGALGERLRKLVDAGRLEVHLGFRIAALVQVHGALTVMADNPDLPAVSGVDAIIGATGARPDHHITNELRTQHDAWLESTELLAPLIDPNEHSCGTVRPHGHRELAHPEQGFYAIGAKSYGRAPNFLMATGYEQARSVVAAITGDMAAADQVQLDLPQTGVCSTNLAGHAPVASGSACCAIPAKGQAAKVSCCA
ncbi:NAD(P)-binding domain-containing protein [Rhodoferax sp. AJA081-3]|uniref:NAD(P)-binding domain-containing protein n=1 Tax=Rhodoferax sp. AJA081-3 TaxID=2752316 RepID=UPI001ADF3096|nr:NAD(P)-binding domain-containing protein [Rhodoferax sp. AJA081-3]QTN29419.1 NAD(P)-binding domain-containing protein [Rhodoferax sp. AJA081-3]